MRVRLSSQGERISDSRLAHSFATALEGIIAAKPGGVVMRQRIWSLAPGERFVFEPRVVHNCGETVISFPAARFDIDAVFFFALLGEILFHSPGPRPHRGIFDRHLIGERLWAGARPALDEMQILARAAVISLWTEICHINNQRVTFPMAARIAKPLPDAGRQMRTAVHHDIALPSLAL